MLMQDGLLITSSLGELDGKVTMLEDALVACKDLKDGVAKAGASLTSHIENTDVLTMYGFTVPCALRWGRGCLVRRICRGMCKGNSISRQEKIRRSRLCRSSHGNARTVFAKDRRWCSHSQSKKICMIRMLFRQKLWWKPAVRLFHRSVGGRDPPVSWPPDAQIYLPAQLCQWAQQLRRIDRFWREFSKRKVKLRRRCRRMNK